MPTRPVCCFGEVLIDFLQDPLQPELFRRYAGGAPANVAVAVARLGGDSHFMGMLGQDLFGEFLHQQLLHYAIIQPSINTERAFVVLGMGLKHSLSGCALI